MPSKSGYTVNTSLMVQSAKIRSYYTSSCRGGIRLLRTLHLLRKNWQKKCFVSEGSHAVTVSPSDASRWEEVQEVKKRRLQRK